MVIASEDRNDPMVPRPGNGMDLTAPILDSCNKSQPVIPFRRWTHEADRPPPHLTVEAEGA